MKPQGKLNDFPKKKQCFPSKKAMFCTKESNVLTENKAAFHRQQP